MTVEALEPTGPEIVRLADLPVIVPMRFVGFGIARGSEIVSGPDEMAHRLLALDREEPMTFEEIMQIGQGVGDSLLPRASDGQTTESLAIDSAERALCDAETRFGIKRSDVSRVYLGTSTANRRAPDISKDLHKKLGIGKKSHTLTVNNACQGGLDALDLAATNLAAYNGCGEGNVALAVGSDVVSRYLGPDINPQYIFSDTSASVVMQSDPDMTSGIILRRALTDTEAKESFDLPAGTGAVIAMSPREVLNSILHLTKFGLSDIAATGNPRLSKMTDDGIDFRLDVGGYKFIAPHLASEVVLKGMTKVLRRAGYDTTRVVNNFFSLGNSSAPSTLGNFIYAMRSHKSESGDHSMAISAAVGFSLLFLAFRH